MTIELYKKHRIHVRVEPGFNRTWRVKIAVSWKTDGIHNVMALGANMYGFSTGGEAQIFGSDRARKWIDSRADNTPGYQS